MIEVNLIDQAGVLSGPEKKRLKSFIIDHCLCTTEEIPWLKHVKVRDDGASGYSGYWTASWTEDGADIRDLVAVIILNSYYLKTVEQMEKTLAHEFGHHWTLGYFMVRREMRHFFKERAPWLYYRIRGIEPINNFAGDYSKDWYHCDKEILAEDYKHLFSPYKWMHRMRNLVGNPTTEVMDYIKTLGKPYW